LSKQTFIIVKNTTIQWSEESGRMIHKLTKNEYNHFLKNSNQQIKELFEFFDEHKNIDVLTSLIFKSESFEELKKEFPNYEERSLAEFIIHARKVGLLELLDNDKYRMTDSGKNYLHGIVHLIIDSHINHGIPDDKMKKIIYDYIGKDEVKKRKEQKEVEHAKEVELGLFPV